LFGNFMVFMTPGPIASLFEMLLDEIYPESASTSTSTSFLWELW
jgi:hypothetical protein